MKDATDNTSDTATLDRDALLTPAQTAAKMRIGERALLANVRRRKIPVVEINPRVYRFHWPSVLAALQRGGGAS